MLSSFLLWFVTFPKALETSQHWIYFYFCKQLGRFGFVGLVEKQSSVKNDV